MQLNHVFKARDLIAKNDSKVAKHQDCAEILSGEKFLDHGFTRPKVVTVALFHTLFIHYIEKALNVTTTNCIWLPYLMNFL